MNFFWRDPRIFSLAYFHFSLCHPTFPLLSFLPQRFEQAEHAQAESRSRIFQGQNFKLTAEAELIDLQSLISGITVVLAIVLQGFRTSYIFSYSAPASKIYQCSAPERSNACPETSEYHFHLHLNSAPEHDFQPSLLL